MLRLKKRDQLPQGSQSRGLMVSRGAAEEGEEAAELGGRCPQAL